MGQRLHRPTSVQARSMILAMALALGATSAAAGDKPSAKTAPAGTAPADCYSSGNTFEMNACAERDRAAADAELNAAYEKAIAKIRAHVDDPPYDARAFEAAFRAAQRAWIAYRDADCRSVTPFVLGGGQAVKGAVFGCLTTKTKARTAEIVEMLEAL